MKLIQPNKLKKVEEYTKIANKIELNDINPIIKPVIEFWISMLLSEKSLEIILMLTNEW